MAAVAASPIAPMKRFENLHPVSVGDSGDELTPATVLDNGSANSKLFTRESGRLCHDLSRSGTARLCSSGHSSRCNKPAQDPFHLVVDSPTAEAGADCILPGSPGTPFSSVDPGQRSGDVETAREALHTAHSGLGVSSELGPGSTRAALQARPGTGVSWLNARRRSQVESPATLEDLRAVSLDIHPCSTLASGRARRGSVSSSLAGTVHERGLRVDSSYVKSSSRSLEPSQAGNVRRNSLCALELNVGAEESAPLKAGVMASSLFSSGQLTAKPRHGRQCLEIGGGPLSDDGLAAPSPTHSLGGDAQRRRRRSSVSMGVDEDMMSGWAHAVANAVDFVYEGQNRRIGVNRTTSGLGDEGPSGRGDTWAKSRGHGKDEDRSARKKSAAAVSTGRNRRSSFVMTPEGKALMEKAEEVDFTYGVDMVGETRALKPVYRTGGNERCEDLVENKKVYTSEDVESFVSQFQRKPRQSVDLSPAESSVEGRRKSNVCGRTRPRRASAVLQEAEMEAALQAAMAQEAVGKTEAGDPEHSGSINSTADNTDRPCNPSSNEKGKVASPASPAAPQPPTRARSMAYRMLSMFSGKKGVLKP